MALPIMKHSPLSAFISFSSILLPFLFWEDTFLAYILIISPIYISYKSYYLAIVLGLIAIFWPNLT